MPPKLFLDVDDVLNVTSPFRRRGGLSDWRTRKVIVAGGVGVVRESYKITWSPTVADRLAGLPAERMWASSWGALANRYLSPLFGWEPLPVAAGPLDPTDQSWTSDDPRKVDGIIAHADVPFVWVDDSAITDTARASLAERVGVPYLLVTPDPDHGLTESDLDQIEQFVVDHHR